MYQDTLHDITNIKEDTPNSVKNPTAGQCKIGDYYQRERGWQKRYITDIEGKDCTYTTYAVKDGKWYKYENFFSHCSLSHIRKWCKD